MSREAYASRRERSRLVALLCLAALGGCEPGPQNEASPEVMEGEGSSEANPNSEGVLGTVILPGVLSEVIITPGVRATQPGSCGDGVLDDGEACDSALHACCSDDCSGAAEAGVSCRAADGACDMEESCDGSAFDCPDDAVADPTQVCRAASDDCDVAEACDGESKDCPADGVAASDAVCRPQADGRLCDAVELCDGQSKICPDDLVLPEGTVCDVAFESCDAFAACDGMSMDCPPLASGAVPPGTVCREAAAGGCDVAEACDGIDPACPVDMLAPPGTSCRVSAGICDLVESCSGESTDCPIDTFESNTVECRASAGICDVAEHCPGDAAACPGDGFVAGGTECRAVAGQCDVAEACTGSAAACPSDAFDTGTPCRASAGACDPAEACDGSSAACPTDARSTGVCRAPVDPICDLEERCDGQRVDCPPDDVAASTVQCRAPAGDCDRPEFCSAGTCPAASSAPWPDGHVCNFNPGTCWLDVCCPGATRNSGNGCELGPTDNLVFVSSSDHSGDLGGYARAHDICNQLASGANLAGTYHAWLSVGPGTRIGPHARDNVGGGEYRLVNGLVVANDLTDLTDGSLDAPIDRSEWAQTRSVPVWTGTGTNGTASGTNCGGWAIGTAAATGVFGRSNLANAGWTMDPTGAAPPPCDSQLALYCFQDDCPGVPYVDFATDPDHCGDCDTRCGPQQSCIGGRCGSYVFVTSVPIPGNMTPYGAGLAGADAFCNERAMRGNAPGVGTWVAWLSIGGQPASTRLVDGAFFLLDGAPVADSIAHLRSTATAPLRTPINLTETGTRLQQSMPVWTGTLANGQPASGGTCGDWAVLQGNGVGGDPLAVGPPWTNAGGFACDAPALLYCFQTARVVAIPTQMQN